MPKHSSKIAVIGLWHLGEIYSAGLAGLGHQVVGVDEDEKVVKDLMEGIPPLAEPGLSETIRKNIAAGRLFYSTDIKNIIGCDTVWFTFDTPVNSRDESDLKPMLKMLRKAVPYIKSDALVVVSSQIPAGTSQMIRDIIHKARPTLRFHYAYTPENLRLGEALNNFLRPERVVIGAESDLAFELLSQILEGLDAVLVKMSPASAEVAKHALNAFLATSISFINDIADVCERVGADVLDVTKALRSDARIGERAALGAGMGFSGGTLGRDLVSLTQNARKNKSTLPVIENVFKKNLSRPEKVVERLAKLLGGLKKKQITIYGLTYKPGTPTLRRSRSLELASLLAKKGAILVLCDPHVPREDVLSEVDKKALVNDNVYDAAKNSHALLFVTPWADFRHLDFAKLMRYSRRQAVILDTSNLLHEESIAIKKQGFRYYGVGR
jgi:UDPglucose 6-dehydrogenase